MDNQEAHQLPDQLLVRYFRAGEIACVHKVTAREGGFSVEINMPDGQIRRDGWRDLGGGLGYVPDLADG